MGTFNTSQFEEFDSETSESEDDLSTEDDSVAESSETLKKTLNYNSFVFKVSLDAEWSKQQSISFQYVFKGTIYKLENQNIIEQQINQNVIVIDESFQPYFPKDDLENFIIKKNCLVLFKNLNKEKSTSFILTTLIEILYNKYQFTPVENAFITITLDIWFYYSLQDFNISFSPNVMRKIYLNKKKLIRQRRSVSGFFNLEVNDFKHLFTFKVNIKDLYGLETAGLSYMSKAYGLDIEKGLELDEYKSLSYEDVIIAYDKKVDKYLLSIGYQGSLEYTG
jgi:hypothetical protein